MREDVCQLVSLERGDIDLLSAVGLNKSYPGVQAINFDADTRLDFAAGEIHALVGENGAGKTTLVNILSGNERPTSGRMTLDGRPYHPGNIGEARRSGVEIVLQEPGLIPALSVAENLFLGRERQFTSYGVLNPIRRRRLAEAALALVGMRISVSVEAASLNVEERKFVELARALSFDPVVLIVDEMTSSLSQQGRRRLFEILRALRKRGKLIIYISHYLEEVFEISDRITVLKDGSLIKTLNTSETDEDQCSVLMVGRATRTSMFDAGGTNTKSRGDVVLSVRDLALPERFRGISFDLHRGEILGIGGLIGCGSDELALSLFGSLRPSSGEIRIRGKLMAKPRPRAAIRKGVGYVPKEREREGLILRLPIKDNIVLAALPWIARFGFTSARQAACIARDLIRRLRIACRSANDAPINLSGGNRQKVVLAKWMVRSSDILILNNPTRGIDVGAKAEVYSLMGEMIRRGTAILLISDELPELIGMSDRILVMRRGEISLRVERDQHPREEQLITYMT
jgi:ABC-type sugar transport system ATPase subunit